jgi:hypothetical protein
LTGVEKYFYFESALGLYRKTFRPGDGESKWSLLAAEREDGTLQMSLPPSAKTALRWLQSPAGWA